MTRWTCPAALCTTSFSQYAQSARVIAVSVLSLGFLVAGCILGRGEREVQRAWRDVEASIS